MQSIGYGTRYWICSWTLLPHSTGLSFNSSRWISPDCLRWGTNVIIPSTYNFSAISGSAHNIKAMTIPLVSGSYCSCSIHSGPPTLSPSTIFNQPHHPRLHEHPPATWKAVVPPSSSLIFTIITSAHICTRYVPPPPDLPFLKLN